MSARAGDQSARGAARALVLQHGEWGPPGLLGEWLEERGIPYEVHRAHRGEPLPQPDGWAFISSRGWNRNPLDVDDPLVAAEMDFLSRAVAADVPVLGLCFGGQALAAVLGGEIRPALIHELGWHVIDSADPDVVPGGPWLEWHYDGFTLPPGAQELARSDAGVQAFRHGLHLGVQFHPESTVDIVAQWARTDAPRLEALGIADGLALLEASPEQVRAARDAAFRLFDAFMDPVAAAAA
jgi:GMP synthase-like glutamine amidotransferase